MDTNNLLGWTFLVLLAIAFAALRVTEPRRRRLRQARQVREDAWLETQFPSFAFPPEEDRYDHDRITRIVVEAQGRKEGE